MFVFLSYIFIIKNNCMFCFNNKVRKLPEKPLFLKCKEIRYMDLTMSLGALFTCLAGKKFKGIPWKCFLKLKIDSFDISQVSDIFLVSKEVKISYFHDFFARIYWHFRILFKFQSKSSIYVDIKSCFAHNLELSDWISRYLNFLEDHNQKSNF